MAHAFFRASLRTSPEMLIHPYPYYLSKILGITFMSLLGILAIVLLVGALILWRVSKTRQSVAAKRTGWAISAIAVIPFVIAFYSAEYEFDERPEQFQALFPQDQLVDCGTSWTNWIRGAMGLSNPCPEDCYRGATVTKKFRMGGIYPPWPETKREIQCWKR